MSKYLYRLSNIACIFFSTHFDDVVGSCGEYITQLTADGDAVLVVTVFGGNPNKNLSELAKSLHAKWGVGENPVIVRKREDSAACAALGAEFMHLDFPDVIYRESNGMPLYESFLIEKLHPADASLKDKILSKLETIKTADAILYFPVGLGQHIDHHILHDVGINMAKSAPVIFYKDFFYKYSPIKQHFRKLDIKIPHDNIHAKISSFENYKSQIPGLFGTFGKMRSYMRQFQEKFYIYKE